MQTTSLPSLISPGKLPAVKSALLKTFGTADVTDIILLTGGLSDSAVYKITVDGKQYLLKSDNPSGTPEKNRCMETAAHAGIAPPVYYSDTAVGISICGFIHGKPLQAVFTSPDALALELAGTIRAIHTLPLFTREGNLLQTVEGLVNEFRQSGMLTDEVFDEGFGYYETIRAHYPWHDTDKVSSHNDLNPNNILCENGKIWIIDWDAAFTNDRYVDLATAANFFITTDTQEKAYLDAYFGPDINDYKMARFFLMQQLCRIIYAMLMFRLADRTKPADTVHDADMQLATMAAVGQRIRTGTFSLSAYECQLLYGKALFNEALKNMRSERFSASVACMMPQS